MILGCTTKRFSILLTLLRTTFILVCWSATLEAQSGEVDSSLVVINEIDQGILDGVELYHAGLCPVNLEDWCLIAGDDSRVQAFVLPSWELYPGEYVVLVEGSDGSVGSTITLGLSDKGHWNIDWSNTTAGGVELRDAEGRTVDFVKWGNYTRMTVDISEWIGPDLSLPLAGMNLGRDMFATDTNCRDDFSVQIGSLGRANDSPPIFLTERLLPGLVDSEYEEKIDVAGPAKPFTFEIVSGRLPSALTLEPKGTIRGSIHEAGEFRFYVRVYDSQFPPKSALKFFTLSTYDFNLTFSKAILLVNGVHWNTYDALINYTYAQRAFWGDYEIDFWDCFESPVEGYPSTLPPPLGHGPVPFDIIGEYSVVIWIGNNYIGDLAVWQESLVFDYVLGGGNLLMMTRMGQDFIDEEFREYLGIQWAEDQENTIDNYISAYPGLQDITIYPYSPAGHTYVAVFSTELVGSESTLLFKETVSFSSDRGLGVWKKPVAGGHYRDSGGQVVFLSGRPYCMDPVELRQNVEYILSHFLGVTSVTPEKIVPKSLSLCQNCPNPFNTMTSIRYVLPEPSEVRLEVFDILGRRVAILLDDEKPAGEYNTTWDGCTDLGIQLASGLYTCRLSAGELTKTRKMIILR